VVQWGRATVGQWGIGAVGQWGSGALASCAEHLGARRLVGWPHVEI